MPRALLHVDDVDGHRAAAAVAAMIKHFDGCTVAVSGSFPWLGVGTGWTRIEAGPLSPDAALALLAAEGGDAQDEPEREAERRIPNQDGFPDSPIPPSTPARWRGSGLDDGRQPGSGPAPRVLSRPQRWRDRERAAP